MAVLILKTSEGLTHLMREASLIIPQFQNLLGVHRHMLGELPSDLWSG